MKDNTIGVVLPFYINDNLDLFKLSVDSILNQKNCSFIIYIGVDGPISFVQKNYLDSLDVKLCKVVYFKKNRGLPSVLNDLINVSLEDNVTYIARMDADDISELNRFENQVMFLNSNTSVDMVGSNSYLIDTLGNVIGEKIVLADVSFTSLLKKCNVIHPSVMMRANFFNKFGFYDPKFKKSQDLELWLRATNKGAVIKNINKKLIRFRYENDLIVRRKKEQKYNREIKARYLSGINYFISVLPNYAIEYLPSFVFKTLLKILS